MNKQLKQMICVAALLALGWNSADAQALGPNYKTAIGFKFYPTAVSVKHFTTSNTAIEGLGYFWRNGFRLTGLYEWHGDISGAKGLKWYVGGGAHVDTWNNNTRDRRWRGDGDGRAAFGVDGVLGLDYKFTGAPINMSIDWQPSVTFAGANYNNPDWVGIAIRFAF